MSPAPRSAGISVAEAALLLGHSPPHVKAMLASGALRGKRVAGNWVVDGQHVGQLQREQAMTAERTARLWLAVIEKLDDGHGVDPRHRAVPETGGAVRSWLFGKRFLDRGPGPLLRVTAAGRAWLAQGEVKAP
jgi:hypothetical protein